LFNKRLHDANTANEEKIENLGEELELAEISGDV
jgi:hypothetical protein